MIKLITNHNAGSLIAPSASVGGDTTFGESALGFMRQIHLSKDLFAIVDDEDFERLIKYNWTIRSEKKSNNNKYAVSIISKNKKIVGYHLMHRLILNLTDPKIIVDHRNRNGLDNRKENLRIATNSENQANRISREGSTSKYLGVSFCKKTNKWRAQIRKGKCFNLGNYETPEQAALVYNQKALELHGEFANLNIL